MAAGAVTVTAARVPLSVIVLVVLVNFKLNFKFGTDSAESEPESVPVSGRQRMGTSTPGLALPA